jgi:hypothetical protein
MGPNVRPAVSLFLLLLLAVAAAAGLPWLSAGHAAVRGCASFSSQAEAEQYFLAQGGGPRQAVGALDPDRDGVACEGLPGPYQGYATIGYNLAHHFFYGSATMPPQGNGGEGYACLHGNRHFPDAPRILRVYRVKPGADEPVFGDRGIGTEVLESSGRLLWRADRVLRGAGRYYAAFEERIPLQPYGANECPGFQSNPVLLGPGSR